MASTSLKVKGHRIDKARLQNDPGLARSMRQFSELFAIELQDEVGVYIGELLRSGRWWKSRNKRYGYYRNWLKMRYGSDRARKMRGGRRTKLADNTEMHVQVAGNQARADVEAYRTKWIIAQLRKAHITTQEHGKRKYYIPLDGKRGGVLNITQAVTEINKMLEKNGRIKAPSSGGMSIKDRRLQNMQDFMAGSGGVSFLRRSHYGQKLLRLAELAAIRHFRNADTVQDFKGQLKTVKQGGRVTPKNGSFAYGFQTGTLAGAWFNNQAVFRNKAGGGIQISILPKKNSGGIAPLWLTGILKKNIQKQGGDPRLLKPAGARRVVRLALKAMSGSGMEGIRLK